MVSDYELTARVRIRDCALRLFAERGPDAVSVREVAACAGVSAPLVLHHFTSKQGLRDAIDQHVAQIFDEMLEAPADALAALAGGDELAVSGFAEMLLRSLPPGSPIPAYLRRLLLSTDPVGHRLFKQWFELSRGLLVEFERMGATRPSADPEVRAAFLMVNDLAMVLMHEHLADVLGVDPLSQEGAQRWGADVIKAYTQGVFTQPPEGAQP